MISPRLAATVRRTALAATFALSVAGCGEKEASPDRPDAPSSQAMDPVTLPGVGAAAAVDPATVVASVDEVTLTRGDLDARVRSVAAQQGIPPQAIGMLTERIETQVIDQFIDSTVLRAEAQRREIVVSDTEVDAVISNMSTRLPPGTTIDEMAAAQGVTMDDVRGDIRANESIRKLYDQETKDVPKAGEDAVVAFYTNNTDRFSVPEQSTARHILIACDEKAPAEDHAKAAAEAEAIRGKLVDGGDFAALATAHSACNSRTRGGDLGAFGRGQMAPPFEDAAFTQAIDAIGPVVKTQFGYHVIQVTARQDAKTLSLEEAHDRIADYLTGRQRNERFGIVIEGLRAKAKIVRPAAAATELLR